MEKDYGFGIISVEKELTNEEFLLKLYGANNKMQTNSLEGFEKLRQENKQLKEQLAVREKALELAISKLYGAEYIALYKNNFIEQAKESIYGTNNNKREG